MKYKLVKDMFPEYLEETNIVVENGKITIYFSSKRKECHCPSCNTPSTKKSTYFTRTLQDLNIIEKPLFLEIRLAKYRCENPECRTNRLNKMLTNFALTESAESVSRKCSSININISGDMLSRSSKEWKLEK